MHACGKIYGQAEGASRDAPRRACRPLVACIAGQPVPPETLAPKLVADLGVGALLLRRAQGGVRHPQPAGSTPRSPCEWEFTLAKTMGYRALLPPPTCNILQHFKTACTIIVTDGCMDNNRCKSVSSEPLVQRVIVERYFMRNCFALCMSVSLHSTHPRSSLVCYLPSGRQSTSQTA